MVQVYGIGRDREAQYSPPPNDQQNTQYSISMYIKSWDFELDFLFSPLKIGENRQQNIKKTIRLSSMSFIALDLH